MTKIVISEVMDEPAVAMLRARFDVAYDAGWVDRPAELAPRLADADAWIVRNRTAVRGSLLEAAPRLRVIGRLGVGLDNIDLDACRARGIEVIPATGANAVAVAEYVIAVSMVLLRGAYRSSAEVAAGRWPRMELAYGREAAGKTMGIVGFGNIGRTTARLARAIGMVVIGADALLPPDSPVWTDEGVMPRILDELLAESDVVTMHVPLLAETRQMIEAKRIGWMKPGAIFVNTARGGIVDEHAVFDALRSGHLGGAALDVYAEEPLAASPMHQQAVAALPNLILTPHIAGVSAEANDRVSTMIAERVAAFFETRE